MPRSLRFIHAADLHLGAPFKGLHPLPPEWEDLLAEGIPKAFLHVVDAAVRNEVDFVAIAGDLFDQAGPSYYEYTLVQRGLERLERAGVPVYFCAGNHDPQEFWDRYYGELPANVHVFPAGEGGFFLHEREGEPLALLAGRGYRQRFWPFGEDIAHGLTREAARAALGVDAPFAVGVLHTGLDIDPLKAPVDPAELVASGMDYWALGHVHSRHVRPADNPRISFSGCIQARAAKNTGPHGVNLVTLREGQPNQVEFIPTAQVAWWRPDVDVASCANLEEVRACIGEELERLQEESQCGRMLVRITLTGATALHAQLADAEVRERLRADLNAAGNPVGEHRYWCEHLANATVQPSGDAPCGEGLFAQTFLQACARDAGNRPRAVSRLQCQLTDYGLEPQHLSLRELDAWEQGARQLVLDLLAEGGAAHA